MEAPGYNPDEDEWAWAYRDSGYVFCRPCKEWHRPPECAIDEQGRALNPFDGEPWERLPVAHDEMTEQVRCHLHEGEN